jgi:uncharacterized cupredoxin-like copper-binding protein
VRLLFPLAVLFAALAVACGDEGEGGDVHVTLSEWSVTLDKESVTEGPIDFDLANDGEREHEFVIIQTDIPAGDLPTNEDGSVDEDAAGVDVEQEVEDLEDGEETSRTYSLDPGHYALICNIVEDIDGEETSHYDQGMFTDLELTEDEG